MWSLEGQGLDTHHQAAACQSLSRSSFPGLISIKSLKVSNIYLLCYNFNLISMLKFQFPKFEFPRGYFTLFEHLFLDISFLL